MSLIDKALSTLVYDLQQTQVLTTKISFKLSEMSLATFDVLWKIGTKVRLLLLLQFCWEKFMIKKALGIHSITVYSEKQELFLLCQTQ